MRTPLYIHVGKRETPQVLPAWLTGDQLPNLIVFAVCLGLLAGALLLTPPDPVAHHVTLAGRHLPSLCTFKNLTGLPCPGCGMVRSITALAHGDVAGSVTHHRLGWLVVAFILSQMMYRLNLLRNSARRPHVDKFGVILKYGFMALAILLALNWILVLIQRAGGMDRLI